MEGTADGRAADGAADEDKTERASTILKSVVPTPVIPTSLTPMQLALAQARLAATKGEVPVGAIVARGRTIIAQAHNETRTDHDPTAHAEILAIRRAAHALGRDRLDGLDLHVTLEPCAMCAGAIAHARIGRLYFGAEDPKGGGVVHGPRVFDQPTSHHRPEVYGGIGEREAANLLRRFFQARR